MLGSRGFGVAKLAITRLAEKLSSDGRLIVLARPTGGEVPATDGLRLLRARPSHAESYARQIGTDSVSSFRKRLSDRTRCYFLVQSQDSIVHATWCTTAAAWTKEIDAYLAPPSGDAYLYESFTLPQMRGKGLYPFALNSIAADLSREHVGRMWVAVEAGNRPSIRAITRAGFKEVFSIRFSWTWGASKVEVVGEPPIDLLRIAANPAR
jgi:hypothetical protein